MSSRSYEWIRQHRQQLHEKYDGKTIIVCEGKVVKVLEDAVNPLVVNRLADQICVGKDWAYTYVGGEEEYLL